MGISRSDRATLIDARERAEKLLSDLQTQQVELRKKWPVIEDVKLLEGREAFEKAIVSARRMLNSLEQSLAAADKMDEV